MVANPSDWPTFKQEGNNHFKSEQYEDAVKSYTKALQLCDDQNEKCILYRNRSACHLKLGKYEETCKDADVSLQIQPNDVKALFRRCQAYEQLGKLEAAYKDVKHLIQLEPKNTAIQQTYRRLTIQAQEKVNRSKSTSAMIGEMIESLSNPNETEERKTLALNNLAIYAHKPGPSELLFNYFPKLTAVLSSGVKFTIGLMKITHGFCENNYSRSISVFKVIPVDKLKSIILSFNDIDVTTNALSVVVSVLTAMVIHFRELNKLKPEDEHKNMLIRENQAFVRKILEDQPLYIELLNLLVNLLSVAAISADGRDAIIDVFIKCISLHKAISDFILVNRGVKKMIDLAALSYFPIAKTNSKLPVSEKAYIHVSVALSLLCETIQYFEQDRKTFSDQAESVVNQLIDSSENVSNMQGLIALSTVIMASRDSGQEIATKNNIIEKVLVLACREEEIAKLLAVEALAHAATDKTVCNSIANTGLDVVQSLYKNSNSVIRVRGLVTLCKVAMKGGGNIKEKILVDGGAEKLYKTCRRYLVNDKKDFELKKWACEGLAYLTLDADVKEILVGDVDALKTLLDLAKSEDTTIIYGICNSLVNLTNAFDKQEKNPELEELAKFAKQPVPEAHEKDADEFVQKRIKALMFNGLIPALVNLTDVRSENTKEMMARVFCAIAEDSTNRGMIIAQGGVKTLLPLSLKGTEKGIDTASQALAKIGITSDPKLAFSGQRCMEVVRPIVKMLHFKKSALLRFEGLMALTNLASMNDEVRKRIMKEKGFFEVEALMFDEDVQLKQAAMECMCNLVMNQEAFDMYKENSSVTERVKLVVLYCGEDPPGLARAAAGTLAILTTDPEVCERVVAVKSHLEILKYLITNDSDEFRHRGLFIVANLMQSSKEIAVPLVEDELFEALLALKATSTKQNIERELNRCFDTAKKWEIIKDNAVQ